MAKSDLESMMRELDELIETLEAGDMPLEQALKQYQRGVKLVASCRERLLAAEQRLNVAAEIGE